MVNILLFRRPKGHLNVRPIRSSPLKAIPTGTCSCNLLTLKFNAMKKMDTTQPGEHTALAAITAVLYFCAILLFAYVFTLS